MMEKHYEHNQDMHMLFVDFKQAFDGIDRYKLYQVNLLASELFLLILAHPVYKMWITQEPNKL